jgi:hypothetical protein
MQRSDLISVFMKRLSRADCVIVVLSNEYLHSRFCMTELYDVYRRSLGERDEFQRRVIPLLLDDTRINDWEELASRRRQHRDDAIGDPGPRRLPLGLKTWVCNSRTQSQLSSGYKTIRWKEFIKIYVHLSTYQGC